MPLNLSTSDGDFIPYIKYNAKAGRFYVRPQGATEDVEVQNPRLAFDMENIRTGWIYFAEGSGPEKVWDPNSTQMAARPAGPKKFKRGFEIMVFGGDNLPGIGTLGLREFAGTANTVITAITQMYAAYEEGVKANAGKVPFYKCVGVKPISGAYGTNYEPRFELVGWVDRQKLPAFDEHLDRADQGAAPSNGNGHDAPPPASEADYGVTNVTTQRGRQALDDEIPF